MERYPDLPERCFVQVADFAQFSLQAVGSMDAAYRIIKTTNSLPAVCGRVCPQEHQCEGKCVLKAKGQPVAIGRLERFVADTYIATTACEQVTGTNACALPLGAKKVACIGSGPSSLTCAGVCATAGIKVDVFEALHEPGGVLIYGIPAFRLPKTVVATEINGLRQAGVDFHLNSVGGRTIDIDDLRKEYDAIFIGVGAGLPVFLGVPGENLVGVFSANEYLTRVNLGRAYNFPSQDTPAYPGKHVTVFGAGNVAMDAARTALRMHKGRPLAYSRTKPVIILEGQIGVGGNGFRHKIFKKAETNDNRRAHCPKGNWHGVEHQADHGCGHGRKAQSKQQGRGKSGRSAKAGSAFNKGSKHEANNDGLQTAVTADALHAALDGFHAAAFFKSIKNKNCAKNNNQNADGNDNALERQSKQIGGR